MKRHLAILASVLLITSPAATGRDYLQEYVILDDGKFIYITNRNYCDGENRSSLWASSWDIGGDEERHLCYHIDGADLVFTLKDGSHLGRVNSSKTELFIVPFPCIGCNPEENPVITYTEMS